jgi:hypothetical protein
LFGTPKGRRGAIKGAGVDGQFLDGEPLALPSGDGVPEGDFVVDFSVEAG